MVDVKPKNVYRKSCRMICIRCFHFLKIDDFLEQFQVPSKIKGQVLLFSKICWYNLWYKNRRNQGLYLITVAFVSEGLLIRCPQFLYQQSLVFIVRLCYLCHQKEIIEGSVYLSSVYLPLSLSFHSSIHLCEKNLSSSCSLESQLGFQLIELQKRQYDTEYLISGFEKTWVQAWLHHFLAT